MADPDPTEPPAAPGERGPSHARALAGLVAGPLVFAAMLLAGPPGDLAPAAWRAGAAGVLMAIWWITEAIPIPATSLLPVALFPLLGVAKLDRAASPYAHPVIFLFLGGFLIAQAMQRWGLHRRLALHVLRVVGTGPRNVVGGFLVASALVSMWVSNTATVAMLFPIGLSVVHLVIGEEGPAERESGRVATAILLAIAYGASIGGIATLVGSPPNALLAGYMAESYGLSVTFARWMAIGLPLVVIMLPVCWLVLTRVAFPVGHAEIPGARAMVASELAALGRPARGERLAAGVFALVAAAWVTRPFLARVVPGLSDAGIGIAGGLLLFVLPVNARQGRFVLDWPSAAKLPWGVLLLFGGGLSLAAAIGDTGLADAIGGALSGVAVLPLMALVLLVTLVMIFLTELTSNTASAATFLPILAPLAVGLGHGPLVLAVPATIAASCAFMLPVATPPNAIVFASGHLTVPQMARAGLMLNLGFSVLIAAAAWWLVPLVFGVHGAVAPGP